jgi:hypothetical protein
VYTIDHPLARQFKPSRATPALGISYPLPLPSPQNQTGKKEKEAD